MKFRYYLRGIGIGIIFASIIFLLAYREYVPSKMTNEEIIERAKQLGMVEANDPINKLIDKKSDASSEDNNINDTNESTADKDVANNSEDAASAKNKETKSTEKISSDTTEEKTTEKVSSNTTEEKTTEKASSETTEEKTTESKSTEATTPKATTEAMARDEEVEITITKGSSSYPVCQKLEELGLIDDAEKYDNYLIEHGYATRISVGTHKLKKGMDYHTIAELISDSTD